MPIAADSQTAAAVVRPCTAPRRVIMIPAPKKPMPETICSDAGRVEFDRARLQDIAEAILTDQQDQRRRRADDGLGPQSRALALDCAFQADQRCQPERGQEFDDLPGALTRSPSGESASQICMSDKLVHRRQIQRVDLTTCE
jgi:hypothetical protein